MLGSFVSRGLDGDLLTVAWPWLLNWYNRRYNFYRCIFSLSIFEKLISQHGKGILCNADKPKLYFLVRAASSPLTPSKTVELSQESFWLLENIQVSCQNSVWKLSNLIIQDSSFLCLHCWIFVQATAWGKDLEISNLRVNCIRFEPVNHGNWNWLRGVSTLLCLSFPLLYFQKGIAALMGTDLQNRAHRLGCLP